MVVTPEFAADVAEILARRHDNGADYWATPDRKLAKGGQFSTRPTLSWLPRPN